MSGPGVVRIKRKRSLPVPERLIVEPPGKKTKHHVHYILQRDDEPSMTGSNDSQSGKQESGQVAASTANEQLAPHDMASQLHSDGPSSRTTVHMERRIFHLKRPIASNGNGRKRKQGDHGIATFVERRVKKRTSVSADNQAGEDGISAPRSASEIFKRPSKRAAIPSSGVAALAAPKHDLEGIADSLHQFALEEAAKDTPKILRVPKLSGQRSREIHQQRTRSAIAAAQQQDPDVDMDKDEDTEYVYDTYVLAPTISVGVAQVEAQSSSGSVGYLVITEEDQEIWEEYIEDEPSDKDWNSDEDDENAEDWYGADYPEEELAMDDELDEDPYKYHKHELSGDEAWNSNDPSWSDDEYERQTQPWNTKTSKRYRKYLEGGQAESDENGDDNVDTRF